MGRRPGWRASPAKRRRLLPPSARAVGYSPFFRPLSHRFLRPFPGPFRRVACKGEVPSRTARSISAHLRAETSPPQSSSDEESDPDEDDDGEEQDNTEETVQVDFEFFDPKPEDFHGVKLLLRCYLGDREWDLSGFVDLILEQTTVGTLVKLNRGEDEEDADEELAAGGAENDDEGPYAIITALNLGRYAGYQCIRELKEYLIKVCCDDAIRNKLQAMLEGEQAHNMGLLVCERFVNFPYPPVPHLYDALFDEVSWATEDEKTQEIRDSFCFKFYLLLTRIFMKKDADIGKERSKVSQGKKKNGSNHFKVGSCGSEEPIIYTKAEDELFHKLCLLSFTFNFPRKEQFVPPELKNYKEIGLVMVVESNKVPTFREEVKTFLSET